MSNTVIALIVGIPFGILGLYIIWITVMGMRENKQAVIERNQEQEELFSEMVNDSKEFKVGEIIPFTDYSKFGGFTTPNQISVLIYGSREYAAQHYHVEIGSEILIEENTFIVKGLNPKENKITLQMLAAIT